eukprot:GHVN01066323.1.p1 GENE.GHVN01066323.1~~GHVN01066323.1.p1  ORF type:complete len:2069 (-),score=299.26 GHVN01066323.1:2034-7499(-)
MLHAGRNAWQSEVNSCRDKWASTTSVFQLGRLAHLLTQAQNSDLSGTPNDEKITIVEDQMVVCSVTREILHQMLMGQNDASDNSNLRESARKLGLKVLAPIVANNFVFQPCLGTKRDAVRVSAAEVVELAVRTEEKAHRNGPTGGLGQSSEIGTRKYWLHRVLRILYCGIRQMVSFPSKDAVDLLGSSTPEIPNSITLAVREVEHFASSMSVEHLTLPGWYLNTGSVLGAITLSARLLVFLVDASGPASNERVGEFIRPIFHLVCQWLALSCENERISISPLVHSTSVSENPSHNTSEKSGSKRLIEEMKGDSVNVITFALNFIDMLHSANSGTIIIHSHHRKKEWSRSNNPFNIVVVGPDNKMVEVDASVLNLMKAIPIVGVNYNRIKGIENFQVDQIGAPSTSGGNMKSGVRQFLACRAAWNCLGTITTVYGPLPMPIADPPNMSTTSTTSQWPRPDRDKTMGNDNPESKIVNDAADNVFTMGFTSLVQEGSNKRVALKASIGSTIAGLALSAPQFTSLDGERSHDARALGETEAGVAFRDIGMCRDIKRFETWASTLVVDALLLLGLVGVEKEPRLRAPNLNSDGPGGSNKDTRQCSIVGENNQTNLRLVCVVSEPSLKWMRTTITVEGPPDRELSHSAVVWLYVLLRRLNCETDGVGQLQSKMATVKPIVNRLEEIQKLFASHISNPYLLVAECAWRGLPALLRLKCLVRLQEDSLVDGCSGEIKMGGASITETELRVGSSMTTFANDTSMCGGEQQTIEEELQELAKNLFLLLPRKLAKELGMKIKKTDAVTKMKEEEKDEQLSVSVWDPSAAEDRVIALTQLMDACREVNQLQMIYGFMDQPIPEWTINVVEDGAEQSTTILEGIDFFDPCFADVRPAPTSTSLTPSSTPMLTPPSTVAKTVHKTLAATGGQHEGGYTGITKKKNHEVDFASPKQSTPTTVLCSNQLSAALLPYTFHPHPIVKSIISSFYSVRFGYVWGGEKTSEVKEKRMKTTVASFVKGISSAAPLMRLASCRGLVAFLPSRGWVDVAWCFGRLWRAVVRVLDDLEGAVASVAAQLTRQLILSTINFCNPNHQAPSPSVEAGDSGITVYRLKEDTYSDAKEAVGITIPLLQDIFEQSTNKMIRVICIDTIRQVIECLTQGSSPQSSSASSSSHPRGASADKASYKLGSQMLVKQLPTLVPFLIRCLGALEPAELTRAQFHASNDYGVSTDAFEAARVGVSKTSAVSDLLKKLIPVMSPQLVSQLVDPIAKTLRGGVGPTTRAGACFFLIDLISINGEGAMEPTAASKLLKATANGMTDSSSAVQKASASAFASIAKVARPSEVSEAVEKRILAEPQGFLMEQAHLDKWRAVSGSAAGEICRRCSDKFDDHCCEVLASKSFVLKHSINADVAEEWKMVWEDIGGTDAVGAKVHFKGICEEIVAILQHSSREDKTCGGAACVSLCRPQLIIGADFRSHTVSLNAARNVQTLDSLREALSSTVSASTRNENVEILCEGLLWTTLLILYAQPGCSPPVTVDEQWLGTLLKGLNGVFLAAIRTKKKGRTAILLSLREFLENITHVTSDVNMTLLFRNFRERVSEECYKVLVHILDTTSSATAKTDEDQEESQEKKIIEAKEQLLGAAQRLWLHLLLKENPADESSALKATGLLKMEAFLESTVTSIDATPDFENKIVVVNMWSELFREHKHGALENSAPARCWRGVIRCLGLAVAHPKLRRLCVAAVGCIDCMAMRHIHVQAQAPSAKIDRQVFGFPLPEFEDIATLWHQLLDLIKKLEVSGTDASEFGLQSTPMSQWMIGRVVSNINNILSHHEKQI